MYEIKILSLEEEKILSEEVHKYPCLYDRDQASALPPNDEIHHAVLFW